MTFFMRVSSAVLALALIISASAHAADSPALVAAKKTAYAQMADARRAEMACGFVFDGIRFGTDDHSRLMLFQSFQIARDARDEIDWKVGDGEFVTLKVGRAMAAWRAETLWIEQLFSKERERDDAIRACQDIACVRSVKW